MNRNVLVFNNGGRKVHPLIYASVIEIEPASGRVVCEYRDALA